MKSKDNLPSTQTVNEVSYPVVVYTLHRYLWELLPTTLLFSIVASQSLLTLEAVSVKLRSVLWANLRFDEDFKSIFNKTS